jgi:hypothetical protein
MPAHLPRHSARRRPSSAHRPGSAVLAGLAVLLTTGCGVPQDDAPSGTGQPPPADTGSARSRQSTAHLAADAAERLTADSADGMPASPDRAQSPPLRDPAGPEHAAAEIILNGLAAEGLLVTSIDTDLLESSADQANVVVTVAHSPGHGHPTQSHYELDLTRTTDGWTLAGHREQP